MKEISVEEAARLLKEGKTVLLDVRTDQEYEEEHIEGSLHIPLNELEARVDEIPKDKSIILCLCRSGNRSKVCAEILKNHGFENIYNVKGGLLKWKELGF